MFVQDCEMISNDKVTKDDKLVHIKLFVEYESLNMNISLKDPKWICAMEEEVESIENNNIGDICPTSRKEINWY